MLNNEAEHNTSRVKNSKERTTKTMDNKQPRRAHGARALSPGKRQSVKFNVFGNARLVGEL